MVASTFLWAAAALGLMAPTSAMKLSPRAAAAVIDSPCTNDPAADGSVIQLYNDDGSEIAGYTYTVKCGAWYDAEDIKQVEVPDLTSCLEACHDYNQVFDPATETICYTVGIVTSEGGKCYLRGPPNVPSSPSPPEGAHDSAIWNAD